MPTPKLETYALVWHDHVEHEPVMYVTPGVSSDYSWGPTAIVWTLLISYPKSVRSVIPT